MKTKGILLIAFLALLLHDSSCAFLKGCCGTNDGHDGTEDIPLSNRPVADPQNREIFPANIKDYQLTDELGKGWFSVVKKAKVKKTEEIVAIKIIDETKITRKELDALSEEAKIMEMIRHPNIIKFYKNFEDNEKKKRYIVMEYASKGTVLKYLEKGPMNETEARDKFGQIIDAVVYLHGKNIVHRDLKPENLLISGEGVIKLADFGLSTKFTQDKIFDEFPGSIAYMPPEMIDPVPYNRPMAEVWTLGVVLHELLTGKILFYPDKKLTIDEVRNNILNGTFSDPPGVSPECCAFIRRFMVWDPTKRCILKDLKKENNWLTAIH